MKEKNLLLEGLDCPNCGQKIEDRVGEIKGIKSSRVNYVLKKLTVSYEGDYNEIESEIKKIVNKLEPDVIVKPFEEKAEENTEKKNPFLNDIIRFSVATFLFVAGFFFKEDGVVGIIIPLTAYILAGYDVLIEAVRNIIKREPFDETLLMTIATIGALCLKDFREGAAVMLFFQWGELMQNIAVERSKKSIEKLMQLKPATATVIRNGKEYEVSPEEIQVGEEISVKAGENIPLDGIITQGISQLDCSALTGESQPVEIQQGQEVLSGSVNLTGVIHIKVTKEYKNSAVAKILDMVQNSSEKKAKTEKFITRFARVYTPVVTICAVLLAVVPSLIFGSFTKWLYRGLLFLVVSCPCALVISVPLSFFCAVGGASAKGILIKGAKSIESLSQCKKIACDKTGTLTEGKFSVVKVKAENISESQLIESAALCESNSNHPLAKSIVEYYGKEIDTSRISDVKETAGGGISCKVSGREIICGKRKTLTDAGIKVPENNDENTVVCVAIDGKFAGEILLADKIKKSSPQAVKELENLGIEVVMLTGDRKQTAENYADKLGIKKFYAELLPEQKVEKIENLIKETKDGKVAFAGDGINDAPVIARADTGIAMGGIGSDIAIEAADAVIMNDDMLSVAGAVKISRKAMRIVRENIVFALGVKAVVLILGAAGIAGMWSAVFADVGVSAIAVLNALRCRK